MLPLSGMPPGKPGRGALDRGVDVVVVFLGLHRFAEGGCERFEHGAQRREVQIDPALGPDGAESGAERGREPGLADDEGLRSAGELVELRGVAWVDGGIGLTFERDPLGGLAGDLPVHRSRRLEHAHHLGEIDLTEVECRGIERGGIEAGEIEGHRPGWSRIRGRRCAVGVVRIPELSELRFVGHAVSL